MSRLARLVFLLCGLASSTWSIAFENRGLRTGLFDDQGFPTETAKKLFAPAQPPITVLRGVDIPIAAPNKDGKWEVLDDAACITVRFRVSYDGRIDRLSVLDSQPKDALKSAVLAAMQQWQFDKSSVLRSMILPLDFSYLIEQPVKQASRIPSRNADIPDRPATCLVPLRREQIELAEGVELDGSRDPIYPPAEALRANGAGCVTIAFRIGADGNPADLDLLDAKPNQTYVDIAALDVQRWKLKSALEPKTQYGFVRLGYSPMPKDYPIPECMDAGFAAKHYQPSEAPK